MTKTASTPILKTPAKTPAKSPAKSLAKRPAATRAARTDSDPASLPEDIRDAVSRLKRERIMAAAVDLFYRQGYGHTTLEQVADALGVTKPFIYAHFASKNELLVEICSRAIKLAHDSLNRALTQEGTASQRLKLVASDFMAAVLSHQAHAVIYSREEKELKPEDREEINKMRRVFDHKLVALMEEGIAAKEFVVEDVHLAALAIVGIVGWSQVWFRPGGRLTTAEAAQRVSTLVLAMVQAKKLPKP
jgi:AcrR family transcriptional regulator